VIKPWVTRHSTTAGVRGIRGRCERSALRRPRWRDSMRKQDGPL
jgi:hypothetical protein